MKATGFQTALCFSLGVHIVFGFVVLARFHEIKISPPNPGGEQVLTVTLVSVSDANESPTPNMATPAEPATTTPIAPPQPAKTEPVSISVPTPEKPELPQPNAPTPETSEIAPHREPEQSQTKTSTAESKAIEPAQAPSTAVVTAKSIEATNSLNSQLSAGSKEAQSSSNVIGTAKHDSEQKATTVQAGMRVDARPAYRSNPEPPYPLIARRRRLEGSVILTVTVNTRGRAEDVKIKSSSGIPVLDEAALQTVKEWDFEPARQNSIAVSSQIEVPIRFKLTK